MKQLLAAIGLMVAALAYHSCTRATAQTVWPVNTPLGSAAAFARSVYHEASYDEPGGTDALVYTAPAGRDVIITCMAVADDLSNPTALQIWTENQVGTQTPLVIEALDNWGGTTKAAYLPQFGGNVPNGWRIKSGHKILVRHESGGQLRGGFWFWGWRP